MGLITYVIRIDGDYDNQVDESLYCQYWRGAGTAEHRSDRVVVGADQATAGSPAQISDASDDVISWQ